MKLIPFAYLLFVTAPVLSFPMFRDTAPPSREPPPVPEPQTHAATVPPNPYPYYGPPAPAMPPAPSSSSSSLLGKISWGSVAIGAAGGIVAVPIAEDVAHKFMTPSQSAAPPVQPMQPAQPAQYAQYAQPAQPVPGPVSGTPGTPVQ